MLLPVARVAVAALVGSVTYNTCRNVYETIQITSKQQQRQQQALLPLLQLQPLPQSVSELQKLSRQEIIHLYLHYCTAVPSDLANLEGEWNGALLHNNGLTRITKFITNRLFGKGRRWNGKSFDALPSSIMTPTTTTTTTTMNESTSDSSHISGSGWNRFDVLTQYRTNHKMNRHRSKSSRTATTTTAAATTTSSTTVILKTENEHLFEYTLDPSRLYPHESSICLEYTNSQGMLSLWKGMKDELRVLPTTPTGISSSIALNENRSSKSMTKYDILIGLGSLSWSGGIYNCSPFCLYRKCQ